VLIVLQLVVYYLCVVFIFIYRMRYVAAYLLAVLGGNDKPTDKDIKKILSSVGIDADADSINKVINELKGKAVEDVIKAGK
jgi:large subunit ribosomal protein LP2